MKIQRRNRAVARHKEISPELAALLKGVRKTICFDGVVWNIVVQLMREDGFNNNLSGLLAALVREKRDARRKLRRRRSEAGTGSSPEAAAGTACEYSAPRHKKLRTSRPHPFML